MKQELDSKDEIVSVETDEQKIIEITRKLVLTAKSTLLEDDLLYQIIKLTKCDLTTANDILDKMKELGLSVCTNYMMAEYSLQMFAEMRGYVTEELEQLDKKSQEIEEKAEKRESQFMEKYGTDRSKWSDEVWEEFENGD
ncbi:MAG: hypothetical protein OES14_03965 [Nitrosopumilus sp.]|nr:hypothetical protein [Nitrosopumilus sp.]